MHDKSVRTNIHIFFCFLLLQRGHYIRRESTELRERRRNCCNNIQ